jgi:hypothetical protein
MKEDLASPIVVYTAIFGGKDILHDVKQEDNVRYVCFTDTCITSTTWEIVQVQLSSMQDTPRKTARWYKTHPHILFPNTRITIWKDAHLTMTQPVVEYVKLLGKHDFALMKHPRRGCIYQEAEECKRLGLDNVHIINKQMTEYRKTSFPPNLGLVETGCLVSRNTPERNQFFDTWWNEINTQSVRDQLSFNYVMWKLNMKFSTIPAEYIQRSKHAHRDGNTKYERVVVVIPHREENVEQINKVKHIIEMRAGILCGIHFVFDEDRCGWVSMHNKTVQNLAGQFDWYVFGCLDYFPAQDFLKIALQHAKEQNKHLIGFNDGKWFGANFTSGMIHRDLIPKLYKSGTLFYPGYKFHGADPDLTARAKKLNEALYVPEAIYMEIDYIKDLTDSSRLNPDDRALYHKRRGLGFPP